MTVSKEIDIPVVNFSEFSSGSASTRQDCADKILEAFITVGFVYLSDALPPETIDKAFSLSKEFFAKPLEEKMKIEWESFVGKRGFVVKGFLPFTFLMRQVVNRSSTLMIW
jgi:isopenicillin N synthase-like dioxygenase